MQRDTAHILIVDDEPSVRRVVSRALEDAGYTVHAAADRASALDALEARAFSLAILDVQLPDANGLDLCGEISATYGIPVVMLTVVVDESDIVRALESGADDYVRKPFSPRELTARVASVLRRAHPVEPPAPHFTEGMLQLDPRTYRAQIGEEALNLTPTEFRLLAYLAQRRGAIVTHDDLLTHVWGGEYAGEHHMLHVTMSRLRHKLARAGDSIVIRTVPGVGYEFVNEQA
jgi:DNA-binding response OmpR family regulator